MDFRPVLSAAAALALLFPLAATSATTHAKTGATPSPLSKVSPSPRAMKDAKRKQAMAQKKSVQNHQKALTGNSASGENPGNPDAKPTGLPTHAP